MTYIKKWLCERCIYGKKEIIKTETSNYLKPIFIYGQLMMPRINGQSLLFNCQKKGKYIRQYTTVCKFHQNSTLFTVQIKPQFLEFIPFNNSCSTCNGTGYTIEKHYLKTKDRFERKICEICNGKGIIRKG